MGVKPIGSVSFATIAAIAITVLVPSATASATSPDPYTVDATGITLTDGSVFEDGGHVNVEVEGRDDHINFHFDSKCLAPATGVDDRPECFQPIVAANGATAHEIAQFIGETTIPWSAFKLTGEFCITWVQISHLGAHFGVDFGTKWCQETSECIDEPDMSYTFNGATGSGVVVVSGGEEGTLICAPIYIRAGSWDYDRPAYGSPSWSQTLRGFNDVLVDRIGVFPYGPPQIEACRQYDVYASVKGWDDLELPNKLHGPNDPYEPRFLHDILKNKGPNPTYSHTDSQGCEPPPPPPPFVCPAVIDGPVATNLDEAGWTHIGTRATGEWEYVSGAIVLRTTDSLNPGSSQNKATLYRTNTAPMATFGEPTVTFGAGSGSKPGLQYGIDADNDGTIDGILVSEPWVAGYGDSWSLFAPPGGTLAQFMKDGAPQTGGGKASQWWGSWNEWIEAFPDARGADYLGLSLGSGVLGEWEVTSFTAGCTNYTFDFIPQVVVPASPTANIQGICVAEPGTGSVAVINASNPAPTAPNTIGTDTTITIEVDGEEVHEKVLTPGQDLVDYTLPFAEDSGDYFVEVFADGVLIASLTVSSDCALNIIQDPPKLVQENSCTVEAALPKPEVSDKWTTAWDRPFTGPGTYTITYTAAEGMTFASGKTFTETITVKDKLSLDCFLAGTGFDGDDLVKITTLLLVIGSGLLLYDNRRRRVTVKS